ncbi:putative LPS assembly protein LptD [Mucilaginibacter sp. L3T2-6]|uniref:putative LPS assembly protein LptD n=1 Tax=Mucilaginibacter sp. L3T2-6 TaxID=3062491 RepID=UPI00267691A2|nr:putative LPS assembly protein LptD [Mucilaginibacter sp. L3T2-6]MDO3643113.1 putative LPS assembly protein LptD [Mucilaginibacter sp. L3T2-6]MDV6215880.1 putative LPS assembly protein LptD [Mucilaginibacter sp. L3T2-6]
MASSRISSAVYFTLQTDKTKKSDTAKTNKPPKSKKSKSKPAAKGAPSKNDTTKESLGDVKSEVKWHAEDSTVTDNVHNIVYLYGQARVTYEDFELDADYIRLDKNNNLLFAKGSIDPLTKRYVGRPISKQKNDKPVESDSLLFNYKTKKGRVFNPASEQDGNFLSGGELKKLNDNEVAYRNTTFSTCDLPQPDTHFGIVITKGIGEKNRIISGPAYLEIEGIPLPLAIPFGFFPKPDTRASGVIIPTFGEDQKLGFYLRNFGYYIGISDYLDLTNTGTIYSKGSYELNTTAHYLKRYKYGGTVSLSYGSHNYGLEGDPAQKDFNITWSHSQDANAHPGSTFSASVNAGTSTYYRNNPAQNNYNINSLTQNNLRSSINYSKTFTGTPFNLSVGLSHSQDLTNKTVTLQLPTLSFTMASINPFDSKDRVGEQKWYQKINVSYSLSATNDLDNIPEAQLFKGSTLAKKMQTRAVHQIPVGLSLNILKYFQFSSSATYTEHWYLQTVNKRFIRGNTLPNGLPNESPNIPFVDTVSGFKRGDSYTLSTGLSTKLYSTVNFKKGNIIAIRHVMTPSISFNYSPNFADPSFGYYKTIVSNANVPLPVTTNTYSIFPDNFPSAGKQAGISFNLDNTIEMKLKPKTTDTSGKARKVHLIDGFSISTFYNFAQDSLKLSPISFSAHTAILNQKVNVSIYGSLNPYVTQVIDTIQNGQITRYAHDINRYTFQDGMFPRLTNISLSLSGSLNSTSFKPKPPVQAMNTLQTITPQQAQRLAFINSDPSAYVDFNVPWNLSFNYNFSFNNNVINTNSTNTLMLSGDVNITSKWKVQYNTNIDIRQGKLAVSSFGIYRDLHCWDLNVQWVPFGIYKSYNVTLKVKAAVLQDLKLSKRSDYNSNSYFNGN